MLKLIEAINVLTLFLGIGSADSDNLLIPFLMVVVPGFILSAIYNTNDNEEV